MDKINLKHNLVVQRMFSRGGLGLLRFARRLSTMATPSPQDLRGMTCVGMCGPHTPLVPENELAERTAALPLWTLGDLSLIHI